MFGRSGASVEFLADWQLSDALLRIVTQARERLTLVSPYNRHWGHLKREVIAAQSRGVAVTIYYRADEPSPMSDYENVKGIPIRMLHAKIYANESATLVTTMNLLETSASYSREVGFLVRDAKLQKEVDAYIKSLADGAVPEPSLGAEPVVGNSAIPRRPQVETASDIIDAINASGLCIECGIAKEFDLDRPLCVACYGRFGRNGMHKLCHKCGKAHRSRLNLPLCQPCDAARQAAGVSPSASS